MMDCLWFGMRRGDAGGLLTQTVIKQGNRWWGKEGPDVEGKEALLLFCVANLPYKKKNEQLIWVFWGQRSVITAVKQNTVYYISNYTFAGI